MSEIMMGLFRAPTFKIEDRRQLAMRVLDALHRDKDCRYKAFGEWQKLTAEETANWEARETLAKILKTFPEPVRNSDVPPPSAVEAPHAKSVDRAA